MQLGADYADDASGFKIVGPQDHFAYGDPLAYVVILDQPINQTSIQFIVAKVESSGSESVVLSTDVSVSNPNFNEFANKFSSTGVLLSGGPPGTYRLEISDYHSIVAQATFTYTG